jgi:hypothetical protein
VPSMHDASALRFSTRPPGHGVFSSGDHNPDGVVPAPWPRAGVHQVTLKERTTTVLVKSVVSKSDGKYVGEIYGFEPPSSSGPRGMAVGDSIEFSDQHIFTAGS